MDASQDRLEGLQFGGPATYRIVVQGQLDDDWSARIAGMTIRAIRSDGEDWVSTLEGPILDQAQLSGVLATLHSLHLPLLRVERLQASSDPERDSDRRERS